MRFGSNIAVSAGKEFITAIDERGRFVVPSAVRQAAKTISGTVRVIGRGSVTACTRACEDARAAFRPGSIPGRGPEVKI